MIHITRLTKLGLSVLLLGGSLSLWPESSAAAGLQDSARANARVQLQSSRTTGAQVGSAPIIGSARRKNTEINNFYAMLGAGIIQIKAPDGSTLPWQADIRLGYTWNAHRVELALMPGIRDDNLNKLETETPLASALLYRYSPSPNKPVRTDLILGYSQVEIKSRYIDVPELTEKFSGVSFGIGFEERLQSMPALKFRLDLMQLYRGKQIRLNNLSMGFVYDF